MREVGLATVKQQHRTNVKQALRRKSTQDGFVIVCDCVSSGERATTTRPKQMPNIEIPPTPDASDEPGDACFHDWPNTCDAASSRRDFLLPPRQGLRHCVCREEQSGPEEIGFAFS